jgi:hypothetical protein
MGRRKASTIIGQTKQDQRNVLQNALLSLLLFIIYPVLSKARWKEKCLACARARVLSSHVK